MSGKTAAADIQEEMRRVRSELREDVREVVGGAREMSDWRYYVRTYPWACVGAAAAIGYFATPNRPEIIQPDAKTLATLAKRHQLVVEQDPAPHVRQTMAQSIFAFGANMMFRAAMAYAGQQLGKIMQPPGEDSPQRHDS